MEKIDQERIKWAYQQAKKRLFFLDLEGTLIPTPIDNGTFFQTSLVELLTRMTSDPINDVVVLSQRTVPEIKDLFNSLPITLVAENGGFYRSSQAEWKSFEGKPLPWREQVARALKTLAALYPGSVVDEKHFSFVWRYGENLVDVPDSDRKQFQVALRTLANQNGLIMHDYNHVVELIDPRIGKDKFASHWAGTHWTYDFIFAIGNDSTDEDLFTLLGRDCSTIRVGSHQGSAARFNLASQGEVIPLLYSLMVESRKPSGDSIP